MISCINPSFIQSNHSINTLRYSDRLKEQTAYVLKQLANGEKINKGINDQKHQNKSVSSNAINHLNINNKKKELEREKELEDINMNVFNVKDDILNDIKFDDRINPTMIF